MTNKNSLQFIKKIIITVIVASLSLNSFALAAQDDSNKAPTQAEIDANKPDSNKLGGPYQNPDPVAPGLAPKNALEQAQNNFTSTALLSSINSQVLGINPYDEKQFEDWIKIGKALLESKQASGALWQKYVTNNYELNPEIAKEIGVNFDMFSKFDIRMIESLNYLVAPKQNGGAGREWLAIPNITRGYNVLASKTYTKDTKKDKNKEADEEAITKYEDALKFISAHSSGWGQAVDVSQIDYVRGSALVYNEKDELVAKKKLPKQPVEVEWQTQWRPDEQPFSEARGLGWLPKGFSDLFKNESNTAFNNLTNMLGNERTINCQLPEENPKINGDNLAQMVIVNLGLVCYLQETELPLDFEPGYDLEQSAIKLGRIITESLSGKNLPASGLVGKDLRELEINVGKEWVGQSLGLPTNTLQTANSHDLIIEAGKNVLAQKLNIKSEYLDNLTSDNVATVVGQGYIEQILNLSPGTMAKNNINEIKFSIGEEKANYIFGKPDMLDKLMDLEQGKTNEFWSGTIAPLDYAKYVGQIHLDRFISPFPRTDLLDSAFGFSSYDENLAKFSPNTAPSDMPEKKWFLENYEFSDVLLDGSFGLAAGQSAKTYFEDNYDLGLKKEPKKVSDFITWYATPKTGSLVQKFLSGQKDVYYEIGLNVLARVFSPDEEMWSFYKEWLRQESNNDVQALADIKPITLPGRDDIPVVYSDVINSEFELREGDLERIFILDRAQEVFQREGTIKLNDAFNLTSESPGSILEDTPETAIDYYGPFYIEKFKALVDETKKITNPQLKSQVDQINNLALEAINYKEQNAQEIEDETRETKYIDIIDKIQKLLVDMAKKNPAGTNLEPLRNTINELIQGTDITNPVNYNKDQIKEDYSNYYMVYGEYKDNIYKVVQGNQTISEMVGNIGLKALANQVLEHPEEEILISANNRVKQNYQKANSVLLEAIGTDGIPGEDFAKTAAEIGNTTFSLDGDLLITKDDIVNFLNGAYLSLSSKVGAKIANQAYGGGDFRGYLGGGVSGDQLRGQINMEGYDSSSANFVLDLFGKSANNFVPSPSLFGNNPSIPNNYSSNIFDVGMGLVGQSLGVDVKNFFQSNKFNVYKNISDFTSSFFSKIKITDDNKSLINTKFIQSLVSGNLRKFFNIEQSLSPAKIFSDLGVDFPFDKIFPSSIMNILQKNLDNADFILKLDIPGFMEKQLNKANLGMATELLNASIMKSFKDIEGINPQALSSLFTTLLDPTLTSQGITKVFQNFLGQSGLLDKLPNDIKGPINILLSADKLGPEQVTGFINSVLLSSDSIDNKDKALISSTLSMAMGGGSFDPQQMIGLLNTAGAFDNMDSKDKAMMEGLLSLAGSKGNIDPGQIMSTLTQTGVFDNMDSKDKAMMEGLLSLASAGGDLNPQKIIGALETAGAFKNMKDKDKAMMQGVLSLVGNKGEINASQMIGLLNTAGAFKNMKDKDKAMMQGVLSLVGNKGEINASQMIGLLNTAGAFKNMKDKDKAMMEGLLSVAGGGKFDAQSAFSLLNSTGAFNKLSDNNKAMVQGIFSIASKGSGSLQPAQIVALAKTAGAFKNIPEKYQGLVSGVLNMALAKKFDPAKTLSLGLQAAGIKEIKIDGIGPIPIDSLLTAYKNPQALLGSIASSLMSKAIVGALGLTPAGLGAILVSSLVAALLSSFFGSSGKVEYYFTACGFYPKFDQADEFSKNELKLVNDAKEKALKTNTPEDWGSFVKLQVEYDTVPADEIEEDNLATQDGTYSQVALNNEQANEIAQYNLAQVVDEAKTKTNEIVQCMDKEKGGGGVFEKGESSSLSDDEKKQIAKYKIKVYLGNLINMGGKTTLSTIDNFFDNSYDSAGGVAADPILFEKTRTLAYNIIDVLTNSFISKTLAASSSDGDNQTKQKYTRLLDFNYSKRDLRPTQILTFEPKDVTHFYVLRDKYWGNIYGSPGSQDIILAGNIIREGFGYNKKMWDRIHYGY